MVEAKFVNVVDGSDVSTSVLVQKPEMTSSLRKLPPTLFPFVIKFLLSRNTMLGLYEYIPLSP